MKLGEYIKQYRQEHGLSMRSFAATCGLSVGYISMLENNRNPQTGEPITPSISSYRAVAEATGISLDSLIGIVDDKISIDSPPAINVSAPMGHADLSENETALLGGYRSMNSDGREELLKYMNYLISRDEYKKGCESDSVSGA